MYLQIPTENHQRLTQEELEEFMRLADMDGDCKLDYEEFAKVMLRR